MTLCRMVQKGNAACRSFCDEAAFPQAAANSTPLPCTFPKDYMHPGLITRPVRGALESSKAKHSRQILPSPGRAVLRRSSTSKRTGRAGAVRKRRRGERLRLQLSGLRAVSRNRTRTFDRLVYDEICSRLDCINSRSIPVCCRCEAGAHHISNSPHFGCCFFHLSFQLFSFVFQLCKGA